MTTETPPEFEAHHPEPQPDYAKGLAWTMGFNAIVKIVLGGLNIYVARILPLAVMGIFGVLGNIYIFAEQMREAGLKQAFYNDGAINPTRFRTYARLSVMSGLTFGIVLSLLSQPLAIFFAVPQLSWSVLWAAFATFMNGLSVIPMAALHKAGRFRDVGLIESTSNFTAAGVSLAMILHGYGIEALVAQLVVRASVQAGLAYWQKPYSVFNHDPKAAREIMRVCTPLVATDVLWLLYSLADQFAIVKLLGMNFGEAVATRSNALYQQGRKILSIPGDFFFFPIFRTTAVAMGNRSSDPEHLSRTFVKAICLSVLLLGTIFGASAALAKPLVLALYTEKYAGTIPIFGIICLSEAFKLTGSFAGSALVAAKKSKIPLYAWLLPYPIAAAGILSTWNHLSLTTIVWSYTAGMVAVNTTVILAAFKYLRVGRAALVRFGECLVIAGITSLLALAISFVPLRPWFLVILAMVTIPPIHLIIIGAIFAKKPLAYLSISGVKLLRETL